jgi:hypothetical protein
MLMGEHPAHIYFLGFASPRREAWDVGLMRSKVNTSRYELKGIQWRGSEFEPAPIAGHGLK